MMRKRSLTPRMGRCPGQPNLAGALGVGKKQGVGGLTSPGGAYHEPQPSVSTHPSLPSLQQKAARTPPRLVARKLTELCRPSPPGFPREGAKPARSARPGLSIPSPRRSPTIAPKTGPWASPDQEGEFSRGGPELESAKRAKEERRKGEKG
jgi:hypothetical protein